jgi:hypothetical protein
MGKSSFCDIVAAMYKRQITVDYIEAWRGLTPFERYIRICMDRLPLLFPQDVYDSHDPLLTSEGLNLPIEYQWNRKVKAPKIDKTLFELPKGFEAGYFKICKRWVKGWRFTFTQKAMEGKNWDIIDGTEDKTACHYKYRRGKLIPGKYPFKTKLKSGLVLSREDGYKYPRYNRQKLLYEVLKRKPSTIDKPIIITTNSLFEITMPQSARDRFYLETEERYMLRLMKYLPVIRFRRAPQSMIHEHLCRILNAESIPYKEANIRKIALSCRGNIRQAIEVCQANKNSLV